MILRSEQDVIDFAVGRTPTKAVWRAITEGRISAWASLTPDPGFYFEVTTAHGVVWEARVAPLPEKLTWRIAWSRSQKTV